MGLNVGSIYTANLAKPIIDTQALLRVSEQILNPKNEQTIDVSKLDLSKFNRVQLGTDFYAERTNGEIALKAAKALTDFDVNLSNGFSANVQYLNSLAAQNLIAAKDRNGLLTISVDALKQNSEMEAILASTQVNETYNMDKDKKGQNPFSFYVHLENEENPEEIEDYKSIDIFA